MWRALRRFSVQRETIQCDVLIVGGGPSGLASSIRLKQLLPDLEVCVIEKGAELGAHILSGNCFEPRALDELIPHWRSLDTPINTPVTQDNFLILTSDSSFHLPSFFIPQTLKNTGNYVISLSETVRWLGSYAEDLGVNIYPGFPAASILYGANDQVEGVITGDFGINKDGKRKDTFQPGVEIKAKQTIFAEGCRGSLSQQLITKYKLQHFNDGERTVTPQTYGIGVKEVWKVRPEKFISGLVMHTLYWPLDSYTLGGGFLYHQQPDIVHVGLVIGLNYKNPYLSPFKEFQRLKTHPKIREFLEDGECIGYGGRALNEGGYFSVPKLTFPGGMLSGCAAGFMNTAKIKGTHTAMKTGMLAAEAIAQSLNSGEDIEGKELKHYYSMYRKSWVWDELYKVRHFRDGFEKNIWRGQVHAFLNSTISDKIRSRFTPSADSKTTGFAEDFKPIEYPKPDGKLTFDVLTSVSRTNTNHESDQPCHLKIKPGMEETYKFSLKMHSGPEQRFCPAGVYEYVQDKLVINAQNCIHCKTCDIKTPGEYIQWTTPEGGGGPF